MKRVLSRLPSSGIVRDSSRRAKHKSAAMAAVGVNKLQKSTCADNSALQCHNGMSLRTKGKSKAISKASVSPQAVGRKSPSPNAATSLSKEAPSDIADASSPAPLQTTVSASSALSCSLPAKEVKEDDLKYKQGDVGATEEVPKKGPNGSQSLRNHVDCELNAAQQKAKARARLGTKIWKLKLQIAAGKKLSASSKPTGSKLTSDEILKITAELDKLTAEGWKATPVGPSQASKRQCLSKASESRFAAPAEEREHDLVVAIKLETKKVGMELCKSMRKRLSRIHSKLLNVQARLPAACTEKSGESNDRMFLGQCVKVDGLSYIIQSTVSVKDPERPGNTTKEYFLLLKTAVDEHKKLLSMYPMGRVPPFYKDYKNEGHKYIPAAKMNELTASIFHPKCLR
jgi:hypothetical protein